MMIIVEASFVAAKLLLRFEASHGIRVDHREHLGETLPDLQIIVTVIIPTLAIRSEGSRKGKRFHGR